MKSILQACEPREDIIKGTFNPEIFTASLSEIIRFYRGEAPGIHPLYTDARTFFEEAAYPTDGLRMVLSEVFGRLSGDNTVPAIHRLETAFGGGKTHALIACAHLGFKGNELSSVTEPSLGGIPLHAPKEVFVVGVAGDEIPVHKPKGPELTPYTLWAKIAYQMGGEALYQAIEDEAASNAAPGKNYFDTVFGGKKVLLMLDELAQYAARLSASRPDGADQLAAFLMSLQGMPAPIRGCRSADPCQRLGCLCRPDPASRQFAVQGPGPGSDHGRCPYHRPGCPGRGEQRGGQRCHARGSGTGCGDLPRPGQASVYQDRHVSG